MFGKKCTLCGGKLVNNKCVECGLDNTKTDKYYQLNQSSCDGEPLTHVHEEPKKHTASKETENKKKKTTKKKTGKLIMIVVVLIMLITNLGSLLGGLFFFVGEQFTDIKEEVGSFGGFEEKQSSRNYADDGMYDHVERELKTGTDSYDATLSQGYYEVGVQIPEGSYSISLAEGEGYVEVDDYVNGIFIWESMSSDTAYEAAITETDDVRLYEGALLKINGNVKIHVVSDQVDSSQQQPPIANPLTETVILKGDVEAGVDFTPGVYDIKAVSGDGWVDLFVPGYMAENSDGELFKTDGIVLAVDSSYNGQEMKNVVLPEGTRLEISDVEIECSPSSVIGSEDYTKYYEQHYQ